MEELERYTVIAVESSKTDELKNYLKEAIAYNSKSIILSSYVKVLCRINVKNKIFVNDTLKIFSDDLDEVFLEYLSSREINEQSARYLSQTLGLSSIDTLLTKLGDMKTSVNIIIVANKIFELFPGTANIRGAINSASGQYKEFLKRMENRNTQIQKPDYVSLEIHENSSLLRKDTEDDQQKIINDYLNTFQDESNVVWSRVWGPENYIKEKKCIGYDGKNCRMLYCLCREIDEDDIPHTEWFKGECDNCYKFIPNISWAVRLPLAHGGFKGCYCCFECITDNNLLDEEEKLMVANLENEIRTFGIMDRSGM